MTVTESRTDDQRVGDLIDELLREHPPADTKPSEFLGAQFDLGLAWVHFPEGHGGLGLSPKLQTVINERIFVGRRAQPVLPQPHRLRHVRPDGRGVGERRAEAALPAPAFHRRGDLVPALLGAGLRLGLRRAVGARGAGRRRVDRQRSEGVDDAGPHLQVGPAGGPHGSRGRQARRPHRVRGRHGGTRRGGAPAASDDGRGRVQRGVLHRHPHRRRRDAGRPGRRMAGVADNAHERAGLDRRCGGPAGAQGAIGAAVNLWRSLPGGAAGRRSPGTS